MHFMEHVSHENSDLLMKFRKEDEKNALLTEQTERRSVLHCNVTVAAWWRENTRDVSAAL